MRNGFTYKFLRVLVAAVMVFSFTGLLSGCSANDFTLYFGIDSMPDNVDPQLADTYSELLTVRNCFNGLTKLDKDGNPVGDIAEKIDVSDDGLTYRFTLKETYWSNKTEVTADDFVFAVTRAASPLTAAPNSRLLRNISGAADILDGKIAELGVYAENDKTVVFRLLKPDTTFLSSLTLAVFMPCNREFFEKCGGKYGLGSKYVITNGKYKISQWPDANYIKLIRVGDGDKKYSDAASVILSSSSTGKTGIERINNKEVGITYADAVDYSSVNTDLYTVIAKYNKTYAIVFNKNTSVGDDADITGAFAKAVHRGLFSVKMSPRFKSADTVIPAEATALTRPLSDNLIQSKYKYSYSSEEARAMLLSAVPRFKNNKLPEISILTTENCEIRTVLTEIVSSWQSNLGTYVNITTLPDEKTLLDKIKTGNYTVALVPFSSDAVDILGSFSDKGIMNIGNPDLDRIYSSISYSDNKEAVEQKVSAAAGILSQESSVIPVITVPTAYIFDSSYKNVFSSPVDGTVDFSIIYK